MTPLPEPRTLVDMLAARAAAWAGRTAFFFDDRPHTFEELWAGVDRFAARLHRRGVRAGDPVVVALPNGAPFFHAFYGAQRLRAVPVPIFPGSDPERCATFLRLCGGRHLVVTDGPAEAQRTAFREMGARRSVAIVPATLPPAGDAPPPVFPDPGPDDLAFIQYTSGSTADPKGVPLTHRQVLTNVRQMIAGMRLVPEDVFVSWLPVYHDMGLILKTMAPFYLGAPLVLLPASLARVHPWLDALTRYRGTFTAAPDTAYRLCVRATRNPERYDLSALRVALNAAEPVRAATMEAFERHFGLCDVMAAGYGLAEAAVGVSMWPPGTPKQVDAEGHVSVGPPFPDIDVRIVGDDGRPLPPGVPGEIAIRSPANTAGYFRNPAATDRLFWRGTHILTGDLGYVDEAGHLFVVARKKDLIKHAGESLYPGDVEETVDGLEGVRRAAAVGIDRGGAAGEQLYLFAELDRHTPPDEAAARELIARIVRRVHGRFGLRPGRVYLLRPRSIPFTPNGKVQRARLRGFYRDGTLRSTERILYPAY